MLSLNSSLSRTIFSIVVIFVAFSWASVRTLAYHQLPRCYKWITSHSFSWADPNFYRGLCLRASASATPHREWFELKTPGVVFCGPTGANLGRYGSCFCSARLFSRSTFYLLPRMPVLFFQKTRTLSSIRMRRIVRGKENLRYNLKPLSIIAFYNTSCASSYICI